MYHRQASLFDQLICVTFEEKKIYLQAQLQQQQASGINMGIFCWAMHHDRYHQIKYSTIGTSEAYHPDKTFYLYYSL